MKKLIVLLTLLTAACNAPVTPAPTEAPQIEPPTATPTDAAPGQPTSPPATNIPPPPAEEIALPDGWVEVSLSAIGVSVAHPPGWEVAAVPDRSKFDVREIDGDGWVEIALINADTSPFWAIADPSQDSQAILESILAAASQDGTFQEPQPGERDAWLAQGRDTIYGEIVLYGVAPFNDQRLLMIGHITADIPEEEQPSAAEDYFPIYRQIFFTVTTD